jgi:hypothetical protein
MGYASAAQRKAVHANKADGGKGHPDNKKGPGRKLGNNALSTLKSRMGAPQKKVPGTKNKVADVKKFVDKRRDRDTIRVSNKYKVNDYVEEYELEDAIKKQTGDYPQLSAQDYSTVKKDKKGNYVISDK